MKVFSHPMRKKMKSAVGGVMESLESRTLFNATLTSPISNLSVTQDSAPTVIPLDPHFTDPLVSGTTVIISTPEGPIPIELSDQATPQTVAAFIQHIQDGTYNNTLFYRSVPGFVIQAGDQVKSDGTLQNLNQFPNIPSEAGQSNVRGSIAMALSTGPNSGNTEYFVNLTNNNGTVQGQPNLDDTSDGGPFTVFGHVIYNGMTVADAIANLPRINQGQLNASLTEQGNATSLPVQNSNGGAAANNLVTTNISESPHLFLTMSSDNPALVTPTLGGADDMTLTYGAGLSGFAHITVTATDLGGNAVSQTFRVHVTGATPGNVVIGAGTALTSVVWTQPDGTVVTEKLGGPGTETLSFANAVTTATKGKTITVAGSNLDPDISITGSTGKTKVSFSASKGTKIGRIGDFTTDSDLGTLSGKSVNLDGDLTIGGSVGSVTLNNASDGAITIGAGPLAMSLKTTAALTDEIITSQAAIKSISTPAITGTSNSTSSLTAPVVGSISVTKGGVTNTSMTLTGATANDLAKLSIKGAAAGMVVTSTGGLGAISAASMINTVIDAGIANGIVLPNFPGDFASVQAIKSVKVKTSKFPTFSNTNIAAEVIGSLSLGRIQTNNAGNAFGVAATSIASLTGVDQTTGKKISLHKVTAANVQALLAKLGFGLGDFVIKMF